MRRFRHHLPYARLVLAVSGVILWAGCAPTSNYSRRGPTSADVLERERQASHVVEIVHVESDLCRRS